MKKILITGGAGFIGSHLCERLLLAGKEVICLDSFITGNKRNIEPFIPNKRFTLIEQDIIFPLSLEGIDEIYNLACPASPPHYQKDPIYTLKTNVLGALHLLGLTKKLRCKILQASTSEVYGDPEQHPQTENYRGSVNIIGPRACYDEGKRCAETLFFDYYRMHDLKIKVVRIFNTYGPRMNPNDGRVVSNFIVQALRNQEITAYGDGRQTRSFCYIDDLVDGILKAMNSSNEFVGPVNLGNPTELSILELAEKIIQLTNSKSKITFRPLPVDDPIQRQPDIEEANKKLAWKPKVKLEEGLIKTINYFNELLSNQLDKNSLEFA